MYFVLIILPLILLSLPLASQGQTVEIQDNKLYKIDGRINFTSATRVKNPSMKNTIVFFRPDDGAIIKQRRAETQTAVELDVKMINKSFDPAVISVSVGTKINFTNADRVIHNAFSTSGKNSFDLGFYPQGESRPWTFKQPGLVKVYCNVHKGMFSYVMVLDTPYFASPSANGVFQLENLPQGRGTLFFWHPSGKTIKQILVVGPNTPDININMRLTKRLLTKHKNKFGKAYRRNKNY